MAADCTSDPIPPAIGRKPAAKIPKVRNNCEKQVETNGKDRKELRTKTRSAEQICELHCVMLCRKKCCKSLANRVIRPRFQDLVTVSNRRRTSQHHRSCTTMTFRQLHGMEHKQQHTGRKNALKCQRQITGGRLRGKGPPSKQIATASTFFGRTTPTKQAQTVAKGKQRRSRRFATGARATRGLLEGRCSVRGACRKRRRICRNW